jgi:hypothetical protein
MCPNPHATPQIEIAQQSPNTYLVTITEGPSETTHSVTITAAERAKYAPAATPESLLRASFEFLLEREPKESIMRQFSLSTIESYFADYPSGLRARL